MEKALKLGKASARGGFRLFVGIVLSNVAMAVGTIILARLLSPADYGLYAVAITPSVMFILFRDWGVDAAVTKYVAHFNAMNEEENTRDIIAAGVIFEVLAGLALCILSILLSGFVASLIHRPEAAIYISVISLTIFLDSLMTAANSTFVGSERMELTSLTIIIQSVVKSVFSPLLVILGFGVMGPVLGYTLSFIVSAAIALIMLYFFLFRNLKKAKISRNNIRRALSTMLHYGVPLSIASLLEGFLVQFYGFMMAIYISDNTLIGNFQVAMTCSVILTFFTFPISSVLFPAFAKLDSERDREALKTVFASSVKYGALFLVPATVALMVLASPLINTLFGDAWVYAPLYLSLYVVSFILQGIGRMSVSGFLRGLGETKTLLKLDIVTQMLGIPLAFLLIPQIGVVGVIAGPIIASIPSTFLGFYCIWRRYEVTAEWKSSAKILAVSTISAVAAYFSLDLFYAAAYIKLIVGTAVFLLVFVISAPFVGAITRSDIGSLRAILSELGFVSKIANLPLGIVERLAEKVRFSGQE